MYISTNDWKAYINKLAKLNDTAAGAIQNYVQENGFGNTDALIEYAYAVVQKYGTGSAALTAAMYDTVAEMSGKFYEPAEMAPNASYGEVAKTVNGVLKTSQNEEEMAGAVSRLVKRAGADTMLQNAKRDRAQFAWIPSGDTCAFCLTLASRGWQYVSKNSLKNGHAEHIHSNCNCTYAVRFSDDDGVDGYDPEVYREMYENAEGRTPNEKINSMRREAYARNKEEINEQKASAEEKRKELNSSAAELINAFTFTEPDENIKKFEEKSRNLKNERAIITDPDGNIWDQQQGRGRHVSIETPPAAGYTFSHTHPEPVTFSVADVRGFEKSGFKQMRAAAPDRTYILEALNPVQKGDGENLFTIEMFKEWTRLDEISDARRKEMNVAAMKIADRAERSAFVQRETKARVPWLEEQQEKWLKENAPKYGYRYKVEMVK